MAPVNRGLSPIISIIGELPRYWADRVFYSALRASGVARWRAWLMYAGVRIGGHWRYKRS